MSNNRVLSKVRENPKDEYYTAYDDIAKEIMSYPPSTFAGKTVYCNADGPTSNFYRFFRDNFSKLKLKTLICTSYGGWGCIVKSGGGEKELRLSNGDFRSPECLRYLKLADIVVTNPPFSLAREFVPLMYQMGKPFILVLPQTVPRYKNVFPYVMAKRLRAGNTPIKKFVTPEGRVAKFGNIFWMTNLPYPRVTPPLIPLTASVKTHRYAEYDKMYLGEQVINVPKLNLIPKDYVGIMGVPESILMKNWQKQFEVVGKANPSIRGKKVYQRILVRRR